MATNRPPLVDADAEAGPNPSQPYDQQDNGNVDFVIQPQGTGDDDDNASDEGYFRSEISILLGPH